MDIIVFGNDMQEAGFIPTKIAQTTTPVKMFGDVVIGKKQKGERMIENPVAIHGAVPLVIDRINSYTENCWMLVNLEYEEGNNIAKICGFKKIGTKVNSFSDIINVYIRDDTNNMIYINKEKHINDLCIEKITDINPDVMKSFQSKLEKMENLFANHYSNYNKGNAWSAVSLKGFGKDITFIEKPDEMNKKWKKEHEGEEFTLQNTELMEHFSPEIDTILSKFDRVERVRLMRLEPNEGELERHTDQTDKELGTSDGKIMRLHIPIKTNKDVLFSSWDSDGKEQIRNMREGELWYLDIRKPHRARNNGTEERIHLVIDVIANERMRDLICHI
jgi:hypothetical protein